MRVALEAIDRNQRRSIACGETLLGPSIASDLPRRANQLRELLGCRARSQRTPQVRAVRGVQAQVPETVGGEAAAIAGVAERFGRRGNDAERQSIGERVAIGG